MLHRWRRRAAVACAALVSISLDCARPCGRRQDRPARHLQAPGRDLRGEPQLRQPLRAVGRRQRPAGDRPGRCRSRPHDAGRPDRRPVHVSQAARRQPQHRLPGQRQPRVPGEHPLEAGAVQPGARDVPGCDDNDVHQPLPERAVRVRSVHPGGRDDLPAPEPGVQLRQRDRERGREPGCGSDLRPARRLHHPALNRQSCQSAPRRLSGSPWRMAGSRSATWS